MRGLEPATTVSIASGPLVGPILRRVVGMLAARADLPLDRLDDAVLVADGSGPLLGIFTGRDAVRRVLAEGRDADRTTLAEVMTRDPAAVPPRAAVMEALRLMRDGGFDHVRCWSAAGRLASSPTATSSGRSRRG